MKLTAAKRYLSSSAIRPWQGCRVFARPATSPEGRDDSLNTLGRGHDPGG